MRSLRSSALSRIASASAIGAQGISSVSALSTALRRPVDARFMSLKTLFFLCAARIAARFAPLCRTLCPALCSVNCAALPSKLKRYKHIFICIRRSAC